MGGVSKARNCKEMYEAEASVGEVWIIYGTTQSLSVGNYGKFCSNYFSQGFCFGQNSTTVKFRSKRGLKIWHRNIQKATQSSKEFLHRTVLV